MSTPAQGYASVRALLQEYNNNNNNKSTKKRTTLAPAAATITTPQLHRTSDRHKDSGLEFHSEFEGDHSSPSTNNKSSSLISLHQSGSSSIFEPRMAQLETLEAKMASIEVSLSATPRRKKNASLTGSVRSLVKDASTKELETLRNALRDKENIIQTLKGQLGVQAMLRLNHHHHNGNNFTAMREFSEAERRRAEDRLARLRNDTDAKRLAIKNLKSALERLDITDNIDVRIQQAELEYQLGREELNLLSLLEETRSLQHCLEESSRRTNDAHTLYSCLSTNDTLSIHVIQVNYDPRSPRFGAGQAETCPGLFVDWALDETGLRKGDRLIEVNGKMVLTKSRDDLLRLLQAAPDPATLVLLRKGSSGKVSVITSNHTHREEVAALRSDVEMHRERADEAHRAKDGLRSENIRLTHRISYLEEQVSELLARYGSDADLRVLNQSPIITSTVKSSQNVTNINISSQPSNRSKSSLSNVSNTIISASSPPPCQNKLHRHSKHRSRSSNLLLTTNMDGKKGPNHHHHHHNHQNLKEKDYSSETSTPARRWADQLANGGGSLMDQSYRKATKIVHDLTKYSGHLYEKHKTANARKSTSVMDFRSEIHLGPKFPNDLEDTTPQKETTNGHRLYRKLHDLRSVKSLDLDVDYTSEPIKAKPVPPKKPLRLSLHRAQSLQSVETPPTTPNGSPSNDSRKALKRNYKGEAPLVNGVNQGIVVMNTEKVNGYSVSNGHVHKLADAKWTSFAQTAQKPYHNYNNNNNNVQHHVKKEILKEALREPHERPLNWC